MSDQTPTRYALSVDHLVVAGPDLDVATAAVEAALGVELEAGGSHPGVGTRNRLLGLGSRAYLEVIGPDSDQPEPGAPRPFGIDTLTEPTLVTWALRFHPGESGEHAAGADLDAPTETPPGTPPGYEPFRAMSRRRPDGSTLSWRLSFPSDAVATEGPVQPVPFLIDWALGTSPGESLPAKVSLETLRLAGPAAVAAAVHVAGRALPTESGPAVEVQLVRGELRLEAVLRVGDRRLTWSGSIVESRTDGGS